MLKTLLNTWYSQTFKNLSETPKEQIPILPLLYPKQNNNHNKNIWGLKRLGNASNIISHVPTFIQITVFDKARERGGADFRGPRCSSRNKSLVCIGQGRTVSSKKWGRHLCCSLVFPLSISLTPQLLLWNSRPSSHEWSAWYREQCILGSA